VIAAHRPDTDIDTTRPKGEVYSDELIGNGSVKVAVDKIEKKIAKPSHLDGKVAPMSTFIRQP